MSDVAIHPCRTVESDPDFRMTRTRYTADLNSLYLELLGAFDFTGFGGFVVIGAVSALLLIHRVIWSAGFTKTTLSGLINHRSW